MMSAKKVQNYSKRTLIFYNKWKTYKTKATIQYMKNEELLQKEPSQAYDCLSGKQFAVNVVEPTSVACLSEYMA